MGRVHNSSSSSVRCGDQRHGRHFVLVADGRLRASDKITEQTKYSQASPNPAGKMAIPSFPDRSGYCRDPE